MQNNIWKTCSHDTRSTLLVHYCSLAVRIERAETNTPAVYMTFRNYKFITIRDIHVVTLTGTHAWEVHSCASIYLYIADRRRS